MQIYIIKTGQFNEAYPLANGKDQSSMIEISTADMRLDSHLIDYDYMKKRYNINISNEEILIFLSNRQAWLKFLESNAEHCLVMEDNVKLLGDLFEISNSISSFAEDWDISFPFNKLEEKDIKKGQPYFLNFYWGSSVYFLSRSGAEKLLSINAIKQPLDDEILSLTHTDTLETYYEQTAWFQIEFDKALVHKGRNREIKETLLRYNAWSEHNKELIRKALNIISSVASEAGARLILHGGSLLGYVRHGQILPWDDDVDLGIDENDLEKFENAIIKDGRLKWMEGFENHTNTVYYKLWLEEGEEITGFPYKFPFIDLWLYRGEQDDIIFHNGIMFPNALNSGFEKVLFEGAQYNIPGNSLECLDSWYTGWRTQIKVYPYCHRLEGYTNRPFKTDIITDEHGRFVDYKTC
ncbi:LicD family protein [Mucilaginibacter aquaedulcis]|uniref:LicD family protein n=1 Tax=Mucilaginibacter aquaedulcis TaxID=1187081 RepID=UPI0025B39CAA|nr:LicD family protein [Mucilaginibacter aquaedulcis]MDN3548785.1 LicD family protein [Mucilaginibacter aquaedulcis]